MSFEIYRNDNITVLRVFCAGLLNRALQLFSNEYNFKILYKSKDGNIIFSCPNDFISSKNKIKFVRALFNK